MIFESQEQLEACVVYWQGVLRLRDWKIVARLLVDYDMRNGSLGLNHVHWPDRSCTIEVNRISEHGLARSHDQEHTLVHEMVHLLTRPIVRRLDSTDNGGSNLDEEEVAINMITDALIALNRK